MRWIRTAEGDKAHAVFKRHADATVCGIKLTKAVEIVTPTDDSRCGNCDWEWRRIGRIGRLKLKRSKPDEYMPHFTFRDWEDI